MAQHMLYNPIYILSISPLTDMHELLNSGVALFRALPDSQAMHGQADQIQIAWIPYVGRQRDSHDLLGGCVTDCFH